MDRKPNGYASALYALDQIERTAEEAGGAYVVATLVNGGLSIDVWENGPRDDRTPLLEIKRRVS